MLSTVSKLNWYVVEQPSFVARGVEAYQTGELNFVETMEQVANIEPPDVIIFSGVLQYLDDPYDILSRAVELGPSAIIVDRSPMSAAADDTFTIQHIPRDIFEARLPFRIFGKDSLANCLSPNYRELVRFSTVDPDMSAGAMAVRFHGFLFEKST